MTVSEGKRANEQHAFPWVKTPPQKARCENVRAQQLLARCKVRGQRNHWDNGIIKEGMAQP